MSKSKGVGGVSIFTGADLVGSMLAVFTEVTPAMNLAMQIELREQVIDGTS